MVMGRPRLASTGPRMASILARLPAIGSAAISSIRGILVATGAAPGAGDDDLALVKTSITLESMPFTGGSS